MAEFGDAVRVETLRLLADGINDGHFLFSETTHVSICSCCQRYAFLIFYHPKLLHDLVECAVDPVPALRYRAEFDGVVGKAGDGHSALAV